MHYGRVLERAYRVTFSQKVTVRAPAFVCRLSLIAVDSANGLFAFNKRHL